MADNNVSRRRVLQGVAAGAAATGVAGQVSANDGGSEGHIVGLEAGAGFDVATKRANEVRQKLDFGGIGKAVAGQFPPEAVNGLESNPNVRYVEENGRMEKLAQKLPWGIDRVDADVLHGNGQDASGTTIAVLDTGLDDDHPDLGANVVGGKAFETQCGAESGGCRYGAEGYNGNDCNFAWSDDDDHGTHCAGSADAVDDTGGVVGVSTSADLLAGKVLTGCGSGSFSAISSGVKWATDQGADVISMSLGASSGSSSLKDACQYAYDNNVVIVAAAGNDGPCTDCVGYPAAYSTVVAVSATDSTDSLADYSSTGTEVEIAAPGSNVLSTIPPESDDGSTYENGYEKFSGTSMATPHVAGGAAQVIANTSISDNQKVIDRLKSTAEDIGLASNEQGAGLLDAENAVGGSSSNSSPTVDSLSMTEVETSDGDAEFDVSWQVGDSDGNLSTVDLTLTDDTAGSQEDTASISVSGSSASGTTRLVAASDDGSGNSYTASLTVTDGSGATASGSTSTSETEDTNSSPAVDSLSATEVETSDSDAEFDVSWDVSDSDGNLSTVDLTLTDDTAGATDDTASVSVSGSSASGTTRLVAASDDGSGNSYTVSATVTDGSGATGSGSTSVSETESTASAPTVDSHAVSTRSTGPWTRVTADWGVSDADGDLDSVVVEIRDGSGSTLNSTTVSVSGSSASGSNELKTRGTPSTSVVTVSDTAGNSDSSSKSV